MMRQLLILGIRGVPAAHGGFETFAARLAPWMREHGWDVTVYCQGSESGQREEDDWEGVRRIHIPVARNGTAGTIEFDVRSTQDALRQPGLLLTLGYNTGFLSAWARLHGRRNVINMDGIEWRRAKYSFGAKTYLWLNERIAALSGDRLVADHPRIADHLATRVKAGRIDTIAYGSEGVFEADPAPLARLGVEPGRFLTLIARPEPENSILEVVRAFSEQPRGTRLVVLGKYDNGAYRRTVREAAGPEVIFPGAIYDTPTLCALRFHSAAYVHGHQVGGTNPSLVEALGAGNAIIAHDNGFNRWVAGDAGLYFKDQAGCAAAIGAVLGDPALAARLRAAARARWEEAFTWPAILTQYQEMLERQWQAMHD
jgi:glycosyltransferase involved in cell wall biosynthesis